jgi:uncharacterized repeat protein (TIGR03803 family)
MSVSAAFYATAPVALVKVSGRVITTRNLQLSPLPRAVVLPPPSVPSLVEIVHVFASTADGENPGTLIQAFDGDLYGVAPNNGNLSKGTSFKMTLTGTFTPLHQFAGGADGAGPSGPLIQGTDGDFYGTTGGGGAANSGTIYRMTSTGDVTVLHSFAGGVEGSSPFGSLVQGADGDFYGIASGGASGRGTVFKMTPDGIVTLLHSFSGSDDGEYPNGGLVRATDGNFYGTTYTGGSSNLGTAFRMTPDGTVTVLHAFTGGSDGKHPLVELIQATDGNLYGTTWLGGQADGGTIFKMTLAGDVTILYSFQYAEYPSRLLEAADGNFYGTTFGDDIYAGGSIFRMTPTGAFAILHTFNWIGAVDGSGPCGGLVQATDGHLYGTTCYGGIPHEIGRGTIFRLRLSPTPAAIRLASVRW